MTEPSTVSDVLLQTLHAEGIEYLFANLGTDYPPLVEALQRARRRGRPVPEVVLCAHENTAITAAHGYFLATGQGQGVFVHVGVGTQNLGSALQNAFGGRVPMFIFAGRSPVTTRGEILGSRDNPIHWMQDVRDQAGIIRQYSKWEFNLELPEQAAYAFQRGARVMQSHPRGAVYVTAAREVLGMPAPARAPASPQRFARPEPGTLDESAAARLAERLQQARRPLLVTSYLGRNPEAVPHLVALSEAFQVPVVETVATHLNFPRDHAHHWGYLPGAAVGEADLVLLVDTDVPWIPRHGEPAPETPVVQLDVDPVKPHMVMWDFPVTVSHQVDTARALAQVMAQAERLDGSPDGARGHRERWLQRHRPQVAEPPREGALTVASLCATLGRALPAEAILFDEGVSNTNTVRQQVMRTRPGSYFGLTGGGLGWAGGAALGYKLARPGAEVVALTGDGAYMFSVPSSLYMTAQQAGAPFLSVICNNGGWNAVRLATRRVYGEGGEAFGTGEYHHRMGSTAHLEQVAGAFGAHTAVAHTVEELEQALQAGRQAVAEGRCAVVNAVVSDQ